MLLIGVIRWMMSLFNNPAVRPGMITVFQMKNGKYIMTYEVANTGEWQNKISADMA